MSTVPPRRAPVALAPTHERKLAPGIGPCSTRHWAAETIDQAATAATMREKIGGSHGSRMTNRSVPTMAASVPPSALAAVHRRHSPLLTAAGTSREDSPCIRGTSATENRGPPTQNCYLHRVRN